MFDEIRKAIEQRKTKSAWDRGVNDYALDLIDRLEERALYEKRPPDAKELEPWMLNGADDWTCYSYGGSSLIYDTDIAERLCTPSELKRTKGGERRPNAREEWLDTQARALYQACERVKRAYRAYRTAGGATA